MESRARLFGHPVHQMLVAFPLGLLAGAVGFDLAALLRHDADLFEIAYWLTRAGVLLGALAAVFGYIDWRGLPMGSRARRIGMWHGTGNAIVLGLFALSWALRRHNPFMPPAFALIASFVAMAMVGVTGWLGGELVDRHHVGVSDQPEADLTLTVPHPQSSRVES